MTAKTTEQREREAFYEGAQFHHGCKSWYGSRFSTRSPIAGEVQAEAERRYPDPKQKNAYRIIRDNDGFDWRYTSVVDHSCLLTRERVSIWHDLMERPYVSRITGEPTAEEYE